MNDFPINYPIDKDYAYALRMQTIFNSPYRTVIHIRQKCGDTTLQTPMYVSHDSKNLNIYDCAMDLIDLFKTHRFNFHTNTNQHKFLAFFGSLLCVILILFSSVYNHFRELLQDY